MDGLEDHRGVNGHDAELEKENQMARARESRGGKGGYNARQGGLRHDDEHRQAVTHDVADSQYLQRGEDGAVERAFAAEEAAGEVNQDADKSPDDDYGHGGFGAVGDGRTPGNQ